MSQSGSEWNSKWLSHNVHTTYNYSHLSPSYLLCLSMSHPHLPLWPSFYPTVALSALWFLLRPLFFSIIFSMLNFFLTHLLSIHTVKFSHCLTHSLLFSHSCHSLHTMGQEYYEGSEYLSNMPAEAERTDELEYEVGHYPVSSCHFYFSHLISTQHECL